MLHPIVLDLQSLIHTKLLQNTSSLGRRFAHRSLLARIQEYDLDVNGNTLRRAETVERKAANVSSGFRPQENQDFGAVDKSIDEITDRVRIRAIKHGKPIDQEEHTLAADKCCTGWRYIFVTVVAKLVIQENINSYSRDEPGGTSPEADGSQPSVMSCQGTCQGHHTRVEHESAGPQVTDLPPFEFDPYGFPQLEFHDHCAPADPLVNLFNETTFPLEAWAADEENAPYQPKAPGNSIHEPTYDGQNLGIGTALGEAILQKFLSYLEKKIENVEERVGRVEKHVQALDTEFKEDKEKDCTEFESKVQKVYEWTTEVKQGLRNVENEIKRANNAERA